jgi:putative peptidoglycan lipid II flippase
LTDSRTSGRESTRLVGDSIIRGSALVAAATILLKLVNVFWRPVIGWVFAGEEYRQFTDAHFFAFNIVFMVFCVVDQTVGPAFLPIFSEERNRKGEGEAWRLASAVLVLVLAVSGAAAALAFAFPGAWTALSEILAGRPAPEGASELLELQVAYMAPAFIGVAISVVTYKILNSYKRFFWAQAGEIGMRVVMIACTIGVAVAGVSQNSMARVLGLGVAAGSALRVLTHVLALGRKTFRLRRPGFGDSAMERMLLLAAPLLIGSMIAQLRDLVNNYAVMFPLEDGLVSANGYGRALPSVLDALVPFSVSVAMFPYFCDLVDRNDLRRLGTVLTRSGRVLMLGFFALAGAVAVMSRSFTMAIYAKQPADMIALAALATALYVAVLPALAVEKLLMMGFFSNRRTVTPVVLGAVFSFLSVGISVVGVRLLDFTGARALATVAVGYAVARYLKVLSLAAVLRRTVPIFPARETARFLVRAAVVAGICAGSAWLVKFGYEAWRPVAAALEGGPKARLLFALPEIAAAGVVSIAAGLATVKLLRMEELAWVADWIRRKRAGRGGGQ